MMFKELNEQNLATIYPNTGTATDINSDIEKQRNIILYNLYRKLFTQYIIDRLQIKKYDKSIYESGLDFSTINLEDMDIYQYFSSDLLRYFYLRNNIYIERLNDKELDFLKSKLKSDGTVLDDEEIEFIEKTYQKVIFEDVLKNGDTCMVQYGPNSSNFFARNDSVVIGVRYNEFDDKLEDNEWQELNDKQREFLNSLLERMNKEFVGKLPSNTPISIIEYNDFSIRNRFQENENKDYER